ncbi:DUF5455 family protein [Collimonas fungivorans]|uniref:DUF5455 family protein n=1 Tax=Collimonas fungivorans TaxID=158899 RepID=UPI0005A03FA9|nr:DUF5455 family protein [Collimonas fungivorans]
MLKLVTLLLSGIPAIIAAIISMIGRKLGTAAASIASFVIITAGLIACINVILQNVLALIAIPPFIANSVGLFIPADWVACVTAVVSSRICRAAYDMALMKIKLVNNAS